MARTPKGRVVTPLCYGRFGMQPDRSQQDELAL